MTLLNINLISNSNKERGLQHKGFLSHARSASQPMETSGGLHRAMPN